MLSLNDLRNNFEEISKKIRSRKREYKQLDNFLSIDKKWREISTEIQSLNTKKNELSNNIGKLIQQNKTDEIEKIKNEVNEIKKQIETLTTNEVNVKKELYEILYSLPNIPDPDVPIGVDENDNVEIRKWGDIPSFSFDVKPHWELATNLKIADFERAGKLAGARHTILINDGAKLMRALRNFTLDIHTSCGYNEIQPPVVINPNILYGTGHLPKAADDMFKLNTDQYLSPTEEVPLTGMYNGEVIDGELLPLKLTSSTISFRSEAGSAGKDVRGFIRQHQFYNTEMVVFSKPEQSEQQLEEMTNQCEKILQLLNLPYRVILLCTGDMGSAAVKTYDVEVWFPSENKYREISSCSNCREYQAKGSSIKYKEKNINNYVHTLNGTGTSLNRLWIAILENNQQEDGSILIPDELQKYMNNKKIIK